MTSNQPHGRRPSQKPARAGHGGTPLYQEQNKPRLGNRMDINAELKSLIWDVNEFQTDLIKLGDNIQKHTGSIVSWVNCHVFHTNLPFKNLSDRANTLVDAFNGIDRKLAAFKENGSINNLTEQDRQAFELLCEFASALSKTALLLKNNQTKYLSASKGERKVSFKEICEYTRQYNEYSLYYFEVAGRLQPHINRIFEN